MKADGRLGIAVLAVSCMLLSLLICGVLSTEITASADHQSDRDAAGIQVRTSDLKSVVVEFTVPEFRIKERAVDGKVCQEIEIVGWGSTGEVGAPRLPSYGAMFGVPPDAAVSLQILDSEQVLLDGQYDICPVPTPVVDWGVPGSQGENAYPHARLVGQAFTKDDLAYSKDVLYPPDQIRLADDGYIRQQRYIKVEMRPFQYDPLNGQLYVARRMGIKVSFDYPRGASGLLSSAAEPDPFEELLRRALLNYDTAKNWRAARSKASEKQSSWSELISNGEWYRISVNQTGVYVVTYSDLVNAGLRADSIDPRTFQLFGEGREIAILVHCQVDSVFQPGDYVLFYGESMDGSRYTDVNAYWLTYGQNTGLRMIGRDGSPGGSAPVPTAFDTSSRAEENLQYTSVFEGDDEQERWIWDWIYASTPTSKNYPISLSDIASETYTATLRASLYGYISNPIAPDHHARIYVNDNLVADEWWDGIGWYPIDVGFPSSYLVGGQNTLTVQCPNDTGVGYDLIYIDWFEVGFRRIYASQNDFLMFKGDQPGLWEYQVSRFSSVDVETFDVTDPFSVAHILSTTVEAVGADYLLRFDDEIVSPTHYLAEASSERMAPLSIERDTPSNLSDPANGADYIIITHHDFYTDVLPLATYRESQGFRVALIDIQDIYDEFSYGVFNPNAIHLFLQHSYESWVSPAPSYVLLVGDGTADFKDYRNTGRRTYVPPRLGYVDPFVGEVDADNRYVCVSGSDVWPDMNLGRLPAVTVGEVQGMVTKILNYEQTPPPGTWNEHIVFVADNVPDSAGDFVGFSNDLIVNHLPDEYIPDTIYLNDYCGPPTSPPTACPSARTALVNAINQGRLWVNYIGHGTVSQWAGENIWNLSALSSLTNGAKLPIMLALTCDDGAFANPYSGLNSLGARSVRIVGKGAVASWSPAGQGPVPAHHLLNVGFFDAVFLDNVRDLGAATLAGKLNLYQNGVAHYLLDTFILFGDPALHINALEPDLHLQKTVEPTGTVLAGDVLTYTLIFSNTGPATAFDVVLSDTVPYQLISPTVVYSSPEVLGRVPGVNYAWTITDMVSGTVGMVQFRAVVAPASVPSVIANEAELTSGVLQEVATTSNNLYVANADLRVEKAVEPPGQVDPGDVLTYTLTFTNAGPDPAYGVVLTDILPSLLVTPTVLYTSPAVVAPQPGITYAWTLADLPPHTGGEIRFRAFVSPTVQIGSIVVNEATIAAATLDLVPSNNTVSVTTGVRAPDMFVHKTGPASVNFGQLITYTLSWGNQGEMVAPAVRLTDTLPAGVEYVGDSSGITPGYDPGTGRVVWQMPGDVPAGTQVTFVLTGEVAMDPNLADPLVNSLRIQSGLPDANPSDNTATWPTDLLWPDVGVQVAGPADLTVLTEISHTLTYSNAGDGLAQGVVLTEVLPAGLSYLADDSGLLHTEPLTGTHVWQVGELSSGAGGSFAVTLAVGNYAQVGAAAQATVLIGAATPDADEANNTAGWMAAVLQPDLAVHKTGPVQATARSTMTYTLAYSNAGQGPAFGVVLTDVLPTGLTYLSDDSGLAVTTPLAGTYVWQVGNLVAGQGGTFHLIAQVGTLAETGPEVTNLLRIGSDSPDAAPANDESPWPTSIHQGNNYVYLPVVLKSVP